MSFTSNERKHSLLHLHSVAIGISLDTIYYMYTQNYYLMKHNSITLTFFNSREEFVVTFCGNCDVNMMAMAMKAIQGLYTDSVYTFIQYQLQNLPNPNLVFEMKNDYTCILTIRNISRHYSFLPLNQDNYF